MKDKKFLALSSIFFLLFFVGIVAVTLDKPTSSFLRAKNSVFSPIKSFVIVFPQVGVVSSNNDPSKATKIKISVYVRDVNGELLPNRSIKLLASEERVSITPSNTQTTNDLGMAQFFLTSETFGKVQLTATDVSTSTTILNTPSIEFTQ